MESPYNLMLRNEAPLTLLVNLTSYDYYLSVNLRKRRRRSSSLSGLIGLVRGITSKLASSNQSDGSTIHLVTAIKSLGLANEDEEQLAIRRYCHDYLSDILGLTPAERPSKFILQVNLYRCKPGSKVFEECGSILNWTSSNTKAYVDAIAKIRKGQSFSSYLLSIQPED